MTPPERFDPGTYGRSFAEVYDAWYASTFDTEAAVTALIGMAHGGPVLELGVGTGRLAIPLARAGLPVVGLDASSEMLDLLPAVAPGAAVVAVLGDMSDVGSALDRAGISDRFSLILCACNTVLNLESSDAVTSCLRTSRERLRPGGIIVIEAFVPIDRLDIPRRSLSPAQVDSDVPVFIETQFDPASSRLDGRHVEVRPGSVVVRPWQVLVRSPAELDEDARAAGLVLVDRLGDWNGRPFDEASSSHISIYAPIE